MENYWKPKRNKTYSRYLFNQLTQKEDESFLTFSTRIRNAVQYLEFDSKMNDELMLDRFICGIHDIALREKTFSNVWEFSKFVEFAVQRENTCTQVKSMEGGKSPEHDIYKINSTDTDNKECRKCGSVHA